MSVQDWFAVYGLALEALGQQLTEYNLLDGLDQYSLRGLCLGDTDQKEDIEYNIF